MKNVWQRKHLRNQIASKENVWKNDMPLQFSHSIFLF